MDHRSEIRAFLSSRRAKITPRQAGLPAWGGTRRVPGLRREEVALLAGVSIDYYTRLERGGLDGASDAVLDAIANALQLDEAERAHLDNLARAAQTSPRRRRRPRRPAGIRPELQRILDAMTEAPAYLRNGRRDLLAANRLGRALYRDMYDTADRPVTSPGSSSSTRALAPSSSTGPRPPATWSPPSGSRPAATRTTAA